MSHFLLQSCTRRLSYGIKTTTVANDSKILSYDTKPFAGIAQVVATMTLRNFAIHSDDAMAIQNRPFLRDANADHSENSYLNTLGT